MAARLRLAPRHWIEVRARRALALLLGAALLAGCSATSTPSPTLGPVPRIAVTPWHAPMVLAWAHAYMEDFGPLPFDLEIVQAGVALQGLHDGTYSLAIGSLAPEESLFATPLGVETLGVVVGSGAGATRLTHSQLAALLAGRTTDWSATGGSVGPVLPIVPLPGDDLRDFVEQVLMQGAGFASGARLVATPEQGLALLQEEAGALLLLPLSALPPDLQTTPIDGLSTSDATYPYRAPRVALALKEPSGAIRDWLVWIQAEQLASGK